jgi:alkylation response protein AidB-like acyl-CoA dehydrogenase
MSDLDQFRTETRQWLEANCPDSMRTVGRREDMVVPGRKQTFPSDDAKLWFERMRDKGWTCPEYPTEYGGGGLDVAQAKVLKEEMLKLRCRAPLTDIGIAMLGPALLEFGDEAQKAEHIPKIVRGEIRWCQGYSEPGAGSDLAGLQCRAEDRGDHYLVNGTKIWTSFATEADWIFCLVRTDPDVPKHDGISFLLIDMDTPGITVTPIQLISGDSEFCQVFFEDVHVPVENLVYGVNKGWTVAKGLLKHERKMIAELSQDFIGGTLTLRQAAAEYLGDNAEGKLKEPGLRAAITRHEMNMRAIGLTAHRSHLEGLAGQLDPRIPMIMKYVSTTEFQDKDELMAELLGYRGLGWDDAYFDEEELKSSRSLLFNKSLTIAGGTNEVQLNIIAKRALNLPSH